MTTDRDFEIALRANEVAMFEDGEARLAIALHNIATACDAPDVLDLHAQYAAAAAEWAATAVRTPGKGLMGYVITRDPKATERAEAAWLAYHGRIAALCGHQ